MTAGISSQECVLIFAYGVVGCSTGSACEGQVTIVRGGCVPVQRPQRIESSHLLPPNVLLLGSAAAIFTMLILPLTWLCILILRHGISRFVVQDYVQLNLFCLDQWMDFGSFHS